MQLAASVEDPLSEIARTGEGESNFNIGTDDPDVMRAMIRAALQKDVDAFYSIFAEALEGSVVQKSIDPEVETPVTRIPKKNVIDIE